MRKYDLAIFDLDGTLADTFPWFASVLNETAEQFGFRQVTAEDREVLRASGPREILARLGLPVWRAPMVARHLRARMSKDLQHISLFDGVPRVLASLSDAGVVIALVTSNSEENARSLLGPESAARVAHYACGTAMFGKPSRVKKVLAKSRIAASRAILIGDEIRDHEASLASGVAFGAVSWGYNTKEALAVRQPTELFNDFDDIVRLFNAPAASDPNSTVRL